METTDPAIGRLLDGRYRIEALLAHGGMATVYRAHDMRLERTVAVKIMRPDLASDDEFVTRFIAEARSIAKLSSPNIVAVYDQGTDDGSVYLVMEYVQGRNLRDLLRERGRLDSELALEMMEPVLSALSTAHAAGIVHRDIKPENVLIGTDGQIKVADFGLARAHDTRTGSHVSGTLLGTVNYISPEQALGEPAGPASDVYAAGILLYELLTGELPHTGPTDFVVVRSHIDQDVPPPSDRVSVPAQIDALVHDATARAPENRYASAEEFLVAAREARAHRGNVSTSLALSDVARAEPLAAPPPPPVAATKVIDSDLVSTHISPGSVSDESETASREHHALAIADEEEHGPTYAPEIARNRRRGLLMFSSVVLLAIGMAIAGWWLGSGRWEAAPSLIEMSEAEAVEVAEAAGLSASVSGEEFSETVPKNHVVSQSPDPDEKVLRGGTIELVISQGPERFEIPDVTGMPADKAKQELQDASLVVTIEKRHDDEVEKDRVVSQSLSPGDEVRRDTDITLVVSTGPAPITIEDFTGKPVDNAVSSLEDAGLTTKVTEEFSDDVREGRVISQDPHRGEGVRGDTITLVVSKGGEKVDVPSVIGKKLDDAKKLLRDAGFRVEVVSAGPQFPGQDGKRVVRQRPLVGQLPRGETVTLYVI